jgi:hypothetical protein
MIRFISDFPALFITEKKVLTIADLHVGIERQIYQSGIIIPYQIEKFKEKIDYLIKLTKASKLVILGDLKHEVPGISFQEIKDIPKLLEHLLSKVDIILVSGNHDSQISRIVPQKVKIYDSKGFKIGKFAFVHGHAWPSRSLLDCEYMITAHSHPSVEFWTENFRSIEPCWLKCEIDNEKMFKKYKIKTKIKQGIIMPAFNHLIGGMAFNSKDFEPLGPLLKNEVFKWKNAKVYLLDGTFLGNLNKLKTR